MDIKSTTEQLACSNLNVLVYGHPGTGKTTFASSADKVLIADCESGAQLLGLRGIEADVANVETWDDMNEVLKLAQSGKYETVVIDPLGELLDKLLLKLRSSGFGANGGETLTIGGWGVAKEKFRNTIRRFRDLPVNLVCVAHSVEKKNDEGLVVRPKLSANLDEDVCAMMHVVGYLKAGSDSKTGTTVRELYVSPNDKYYAKDRTGLLPDIINDPSLRGILETVHGSEQFKKMRTHEKKVADFESSLE